MFKIYIFVLIFILSLFKVEGADTIGSQPKVFAAVDERYALGKDSLSWPNALKLCVEHGMRLATAQNSMQSGYIQTFLNANKRHIPESNGFVWLGASNFGMKSIYTWYWTTDGKPVKYSKWAKGNPIIANGFMLINVYKDMEWTHGDILTTNYPLCQTRKASGQMWLGY